MGTPRPKDPVAVGLFPVVQKLIFSVHKLARGAPKDHVDTLPPTIPGADVSRTCAGVGGTNSGSNLDAPQTGSRD